MTTKKKSKAMKFFDKAIGASMSFGTNLEAIRLGESMSQIAFAKKLKISQAHHSQIEKGLKLVSPEMELIWSLKWRRKNLKVIFRPT